jgi:hypothetical protein
MLIIAIISSVVRSGWSFVTAGVGLVCLGVGIEITCWAAGVGVGSRGLGVAQVFAFCFGDGTGAGLGVRGTIPRDLSAAGDLLDFEVIHFDDCLPEERYLKRSTANGSLSSGPTVMVM